MCALEVGWLYASENHLLLEALRWAAAELGGIREIVDCRGSFPAPRLVSFTALWCRISDQLLRDPPASKLERICHPMDIVSPTDWPVRVGQDL